MGNGKPHESSRIKQIAFAVMGIGIAATGAVGTFIARKRRN